jgi:predicted DNA-binding ribbon-helix-helix protein
MLTAGVRQQGNLSSAIRLLVLDYYLALVDRSKSAERHRDEKGHRMNRTAPH